jgi:hypothetical protein
MPTLLEAWLAEQTAERLPWQHLPISDAPHRDDGFDREPLERTTAWLDRWRRALSLMAGVPEPVPLPCDGGSIDKRSGGAR